MPNGLRKTVLVIMGMRGNSSREHLAEVLSAVAGVRDVDVNLHRGRAAITHEARCTLEELVGAVLRAGYGAALFHGAGGEPPPAGGTDAGR